MVRRQCATGWAWPVTVQRVAYVAICVSPQPTVLVRSCYGRSGFEVIGPVRVELLARASEPHFDLFARVCDVTPRGVSRNVCDALASVAPGRFERSDDDGAWRERFDLWPVAHRFAAGIASACRSRLARTPARCETRARERIRLRPRPSGQWRWSSSMVPSGRRCLCSRSR